MARTTATIPDDLTDLIEGAVKAGIFENKSDAIRHVLREYFDQHQNARIAAAVALTRRRRSPSVPLPVWLMSIGSRCGIC
jgi:Arc/MetJ-type ribon-helix-helix transcriptional regulator